MYPELQQSEMGCKCGNCEGNQELTAEAHAMFLKLRDIVGFPFVVTSAFRCEDYDRSLHGGSPSYVPGAHTKGKAIDLLCHGEKGWLISKAAFALGIPRIRWNQKGDFGGRFIHLDIMESGEDANRPSPHIGSY